MLVWLWLWPWLWLVVTAGVAGAGELSPAMRHALRLHDAGAYADATIELDKVARRTTGDAPDVVELAEIRIATALYEMGMPGAAWGKLAWIAERESHLHHAEALSWIAKIARKFPSPSVRGSARGSDPLASARDALRAGELDEGIAAALEAAADRELAGEAARRVASWTRVHREPERARAPLAAIAHPYARYQLSRVASGHARFGNVSVEGFDAVVLATACTAPLPADIIPHVRRTLADLRPRLAELLAIEDDYDRFVAGAKQRTHSVIGRILGDATMQHRLAWIAQLQAETDRILRAPELRRWSASPIGLDILDELTLRVSIEQADSGAHMRQRFALLARDVERLTHALRDAAPLVAGPEVALGDGLVVTAGVCGERPTRPPAVRANGCGGCATHDPGMLVLLALVTLRRRARAR